MFVSQRYKILKALNEKGREKKYLVFDDEEKQRRVIKEVKKDAAGNMGILQSIGHAGLPKVYDVFYNSDDTCIVTEYIEGENLYEYIQNRGVMSWWDALDVFIRISYIIRYLHCLKPDRMIHGSVHPENIIFKDGNIYLVDYGISDEKNTAYMAPELLAGLDTSKESDIYALGMVLNYMVYGKDKRMLYSKENENDLNRLIRRCTALNMKNRICDVNMVLNEAERIKKRLELDKKGEIITKVTTLAGPLDCAYLLADSYSRKFSKKVLLIDTDILHASFTADKKNLNPDLQTLLEKDEVCDSLHSVAENKGLYIIPCALEIEGYENVIYSKLEILLSKLTDDFPVIFIHCTDFIYDSLFMNCILMSDHVLFCLDNVLKDLKLFNQIATYLCNKHGTDPDRYNYCIYENRDEKIHINGVDCHICGRFIGTIRSRRRFADKDCEKILSVLYGKD
ncbi:MAG: protein kinase [Clostridia bacterium]